MAYQHNIYPTRPTTEVTTATTTTAGATSTSTKYSMGPVPGSSGVEFRKGGGWRLFFVVGFILRTGTGHFTDEGE